MERCAGAEHDEHACHVHRERRFGLRVRPGRDEERTGNQPGDERAEMQPPPQEGSPALIVGGAALLALGAGYTLDVVALDGSVHWVTGLRSTGHRPRAHAMLAAASWATRVSSRSASSTSRREIPSRNKMASR